MIRKAVAWGAGVVMVAAAWGAGMLAPTKDAADAPFDVETQIGKPAEGRTFGVVVSDVSVAKKVSMPSTVLAPAWKAEGTWVVVNATAWANGAQPANRLGGATLSFGDTTYSASERVRGGLTSSELVNGVYRSGSLAFQIPAPRAEESAVLRLEPVEGVDRDSAVVLPLNLASLPHVDSLELTPADWTRLP